VILNLPFASPGARGWACFTCGVGAADGAAKGAIAVLCEPCAAPVEREGRDPATFLRFVCDGDDSKHRVPLAGLNLAPRFGHDMALHQETWKCARCGCTQDTPCEHSDGESCAWVHATLCTACASADELQALAKDFERFGREQERAMLRFLYARTPAEVSRIIVPG